MFEVGAVEDAGEGVGGPPEEHALKSGAIATLARPAMETCSQARRDNTTDRSTTTFLPQCVIPVGRWAPGEQQIHETGNVPKREQ
jgi:hypothetical protein